MKNTKLLIGLAVVGGLAYLYSKSKKSSSKTSQSETSQFQNKVNADSAIYGGKGFGQANSVPADKPVFTGYDPEFNAKLSQLYKDGNPFGGVTKEKMFFPTSEIITAKPKSIFDGMVIYN